MTSLISEGAVYSVAWIAFVWAFIIAVVGSILLARWRQREREDAAATEEVMDTLGFDRSHAHEQDIV